SPDDLVVRLREPDAVVVGAPANRVEHPSRLTPASDDPWATEGVLVVIDEIENDPPLRRPVDTVVRFHVTKLVDRKWLAGDDCPLAPADVPHSEPVLEELDERRCPIHKLVVGTIRDRCLLDAMEGLTAVRALRQTCELEVLDPVPELVADVVHEEPIACVDHRRGKDAVVIEGAGPADVEQRLPSETDDFERVRRCDIDVADAANRVLVAAADEDPNHLVAQQVRRGREGIRLRPPEVPVGRVDVPPLVPLHRPSSGTLNASKLLFSIRRAGLPT